MIEKCDNLYHLICDICGEHDSFLEFTDAVDYKKRNGWKSKRYDNDWVDVCPECQKEV